MPEPGVTWGRPCAEGAGVGLDYNKASTWTVGGRRRMKEILIYCSVMFIFTLGWFRAFFLMY